MNLLDSEFWIPASSPAFSRLFCHMFMIRQKDFAVRIDCDAEGPVVTVTHALTGLERTARPASGQTVGSVRDKLLDEVRAAIYNMDEFQIDYTLSVIGGQRVLQQTLIHLPTGKKRKLEGQPFLEMFQDKLDELVTELWNEGICP